LASVDSSPQIAPLRAPQIYEQIAQRLEADIAAGRLTPGERLPSERELAQRLEVGRSSVREAIGALQLSGIVETRPGSGSFVAADAPALLLARDGAGLAHHDASPFALLDAREAFEPAVARMAAGRGGPDAEIERLLAEMDAVVDIASPGQRVTWSEADRLFHRRIGQLAANPVLAAVCDQLAQIMDEPLWRRLRDDSVAERGHLRVHSAEHRMIYEAIVAGDGDAAEFYAREHIRRVRRYMAPPVSAPGGGA
jgi:DNA-binding FadR family transcriptional regulator